MKTVTFNIRIESELRDAFNRAAAASHRSAAQVLRELIRHFVESAPQSKVKPQLSETKLHERRRAVDFVRANTEMEGFFTDDDFKTLEESYANGESEIEDFWQYIEKKIGHLRVKQDVAGQ
ncbi:MAG: antitoxin VbhA family protein [Betaproteobacteria bacterium]|nr:antitoxin VbhA family protein [Betaproteobacteria bacterium]